MTSSFFREILHPPPPWQKVSKSQLLKKKIVTFLKVFYIAKMIFLSTTSVLLCGKSSLIVTNSFCLEIAFQSLRYVSYLQKVLPIKNSCSGPQATSASIPASSLQLQRYWVAIRTLNLLYQPIRGASIRLFDIESKFKRQSSFLRSGREPWPLVISYIFWYFLQINCCIIILIQKKTDQNV